MAKFGNTTINTCNFNNIKVSCYERKACLNTYTNNRVWNEEYYIENEFEVCTREEIDEILDRGNKNGSLLIDIGNIIVGTIVGILVTLLIKKSVFRIKNKSKLKSRDEFRSGSIRVLVNTRNNTNVGNNNNNNIYNNNNQNNNRESINIQKPPPSYSDSVMAIDIKNKDEKKLFNGSVIEDDKPLLSHNNSNSKDETLFTMHQLMTKMKHLSDNKKFN